MILKETIFEVIQECADAKGVSMPDDFKEDFKVNFPGPVRLESFFGIKVNLCDRISNLLKNDKNLAEKYAAIYTQISRGVRLKLVCLLGFEDYITRSSPDGKSSRELLKSFLRTLGEGESWGEKKLSEWEIGDDNIGYRLSARIRGVVGFWNRDVVAVILGEECERLLRSNPFERNEQKIRSIYDTRRYLKLYLASLPPEESWSYATLCAWENDDGFRGESITNYVAGRGDFTEEGVRGVLMEEADALLTRNPFTKRVLNLTDVDSARAALLEFMGGLAEGESWTIVKLRGWENATGMQGGILYKWIDRNYGCFDEHAVRTVLGEDADAVLRRNPYLKLKENIEPKDAQKAFKDFFRELKDSQTWSASDLIEWNQKEGGRIKGASLHCYIIDNYGAFDIPAFIQMFGTRQAIKLLALNPFMPRHTEVVVSEDIAVDYLKRFLDARPEGEYWSPAVLEDCGEIADGVHGFCVYDWFMRNVTHDGKIDWMHILLKLIPLEYLKKHPFRHKFLGDITVEDRGGRSLMPAMTKRREEVQRVMTATEHIDDGFAPDPEELCMAKESTERMMSRKNVMRMVYKYLEPHECQLMNRFYAEEDIGDEQLLFLMGRVREIFLEHKPDLI